MFVFVGSCVFGRGFGRGFGCVFGCVFGCSWSKGVAVLEYMCLVQVCVCMFGFVCFGESELVHE